MFYFGAFVHAYFNNFIMRFYFFLSDMLSHIKFVCFELDVTDIIRIAICETYILHNI